MTRPQRSTKSGMSATARREHLAFANATADAMRKLGARQTSPAYENGPDALTIFAGDFTLDTKAGPLIVHAYGNWIATRFEDPEMGARYTSASLNGKWNWDPCMAGVERGKYDRERKTLALFLEQLQPILLPPGSPPVPARSPDKWFDREIHTALIGRSGYARHDFATRDYFMKSLIPSMQAYVRKEGVPVQAIWQSGSWQIMSAENQPTGRAFVIVDKYGEWQKGPKFDENAIGGAAR